MIKISPLAPSTFPSLPAIAGVRLAAGEAGIKYKNRVDVLLAELTEGTSVAGVFTTSLTASAPVLACRENAKGGKARFLLVNSGNSNAFTGKAGEESVGRITQTVAKLAECAPSEIFTASTGVIGEKLADEKITALLPRLGEELSENAWELAARAIMTTDTFPKAATRRAEIGGTKVTINGIAKGSGMIAPDMATMLAFIFTDAAIPASMLQLLLSDANAKSFNCITVDSDTSTSDTCLLFATGKAGNAPVLGVNDAALGDFKRALGEVMLELAQAIVRDGEGASKFIAITVTRAEHGAAAKRIALSIANSPLVKTAIAGEDANWGRIVMAVGKAGERAERDKLRIEIGGVCVAKDGAVSPDYREESVMSHMKGREIEIKVDVGVGDGNATVWTCDLTHGYIDINGSYRS